MSKPEALSKTGQLPDHARQSRERKRAEALAMGVDEPFVSELVDRFYAAVRADDLLMIVDIAAIIVLRRASRVAIDQAIGKAGA